MEPALIRLVRFLSGPSVWRPAGPAVLVSLSPRASDAWVAPLLRWLPQVAEHPLLRRSRTPAAATVALSDRLLQAVGAGWGRSRVVQGEEGRRLLALACPNRQLAEGLVLCLDRILAALPSGAVGLVEDVLEELIRRWEAPAETSLLAQAARRRGIPVHWPEPACGWTLILGQGARRRVVHGAHLPGSGATGRILADKLICARLLEVAGLPTTHPHLARSVQEAVAVAEELGYPVVIKPNRGLRQIGVWTNLTTAGSVRHAFREAARQSGSLGGPLLVERHIDGGYVRATLVRGRLEAALQAVAPVARGDGVRTAAELAREAVSLPADARLDQRSDGVLEAVLFAQGLRPDTVPAAGRRFRIGHRSQGPSVDVTGRLHPTLRQTLERLGRLFPLPVVGVDVVVAEVDGPFGPGRGVILEVNDNPAFALHDRVDDGVARDLSAVVLHDLLPGDTGRVATVGGGPGCGREIEDRVAALAATLGVCAAGYTGGRLWVGTPASCVGEGPQASRLLPLLSQAGCLALEVDEVLAQEVGLPLDRFDELVGPAPGPDSIGRLLARLSQPSRPGGAKRRAWPPT